MDNQISPEERQVFLDRQGWKRMTPAEREQLEATWDDASILMAITMNLA